jgi:ribonuclease J
MTVTITAVGGFGEVGRNCTAVDVDGQVVIIDLGIHLDYYIKHTEDQETDIAGDPESLRRVGAIPDLRSIKDIEQNVKAIVLSHAHLDHIGAVPFLLEHFKKVPIYGSPFTIALLKELFADKQLSPRQALHVVKSGQRVSLGKGIELELFPITHSTPDSTIVALHTSEGVVVYANDFKLDNHPTLGHPLNLKALESLKPNVLVLINECLNATHATKTPSESVAREMLREVLLETKTQKKAIFLTTFSSHIARLKSMVEVSRALNRTPVFLGRSLAKYLYAAKDAGIYDLTKDAVMVKHGSQAKRFLKNLKNPENYVIITTGHQGEPKALLSRIMDEGLFEWQPEDIVVFSCNVIPTPTIQANRKHLEEKLRKKHLRVFTDVHVSGHASREDLREFLDLLEPRFIIPSHGDPVMTDAYVELAQEQGYTNDRILALREGDRIQFSKLGATKVARPLLPPDNAIPKHFHPGPLAGKARSDSRTSSRPGRQFTSRGSPPDNRR